MTAENDEPESGEESLPTRLRDRITAYDIPMKRLTVMDRKVDPYRLDRPAGHRDAQWFKELIDRFLGSTATVHLRGFHYILVSAGNIVKPHNGEVYRNTDADYEWLGEHPAKAARWLGYVEFERIVDERNAEPEVYCKPSFGGVPRAELSRGFGITPDAATAMLDQMIPSLDLVMPTPRCRSSGPRQPYRIVFVGEKVSLRPVLRPIAERVQGELILPSGELSETLLYDMVERAAAGDHIISSLHSPPRPTVVLYFSDFDPAGYHMPVSVARKVQAHCDLRHPDLDIAVYPVALNFEQVRDLDLPSTPLKETESRKGRWRERWGREQTEIDALAALQPDVLAEIAETAVKPFYDPTLERRWRRVETDWSIAAMRQMRAHPLYDETSTALATILESAETVVANFREGLREAADALDQAQRDAVERMDIAVPDPYQMPTPELPAAPAPLYSSREGWREATERLIAHRDLGGALDEE